MKTLKQVRAAARPSVGAPPRARTERGRSKRLKIWRHLHNLPPLSSSFSHFLLPFSPSPATVRKKMSFLSPFAGKEIPVQQYTGGARKNSPTPNEGKNDLLCTQLVANNYFDIAELLGHRGPIILAKENNCLQHIGRVRALFCPR